MDLTFGAPSEPEITRPPGLDYIHHLQSQLRASVMPTLPQKQAYDVHSQEQDFAPGKQSGFYCPTWKKGKNPKLVSHCKGPVTVSERLGELV